MLCEDLMKTEVLSVAPKDSARIAAAKMRDEGIGFLPVCDSDGRVLGAVTDRDLAMRVIAGGRDADTPVEDVMTREVVACEPEDDLFTAEELMARFRKSRIMCITPDGKLAGVISLADVIEQEGPAAAEKIRQMSEREARA